MARWSTRGSTAPGASASTARSPAARGSSRRTRGVDALHGAGGDAPAPGRLCRVAHAVGGLDHVARGQAVAVELDLAHARAGAVDASFPGELERADGVADLLRHGVGARAAAVLQQHGELVAADARQGVVFAQLPAQEKGELAQQFVAGDVAGAVVDRLEVVQVEVK